MHVIWPKSGNFASRGQSSPELYILLFWKMLLFINFLAFLWELPKNATIFRLSLFSFFFGKCCLSSPHVAQVFSICSPTFCTLKMRHIGPVFVIEKLMRNFLLCNVLRSRLLMERPSSTASAFQHGKKKRVGRIRWPRTFGFKYFYVITAGVLRITGKTMTDKTSITVCCNTNCTPFTGLGNLTRLKNLWWKWWP